MTFSKATILAIASLLPVVFANIYPDQDPCNPIPRLAGEYDAEYNWRMNLDYDRCDCLGPQDPNNPWVPPGPYPTETDQEYAARNAIDAQRCAPAFPVFPPPPAFQYLQPTIPLGPVLIPAIVGGPDWREPRFWRDNRWGHPSPPPNGFHRGERRERPDFHRGEPGRQGPGRPEPGRPEPGRPEPGRPAPGRPEPPRPAEPIHRPEPARPEPARPAPHIEPRPAVPRPAAPGRGGRP